MKAFKILMINLLLIVSSDVISSSFWLIDTKSDVRVFNFLGGDVLSLDEIPSNYSLSYEPAEKPGSSVNIVLSGTVSASRKEGVSPYTLFGDNASRGDYFDNAPGKQLTVGSYTLTVKSANNNEKIEEVAFAVIADEDPIDEDPIDEGPIDSDGDGVPDNEDAFPLNPAETKDSDNDGVGDNGDAFPADPTETRDSDNDGVGDNTDAFPNDPSETTDSDNDGIGDNSDPFPNDANNGNNGNSNISYFYLFDAASDQKLLEISNGLVLDQSQIPSQYAFSYDPPVKDAVSTPVILNLTNTNDGLTIQGIREYYAPYAIFGNNGSNYNPDPQSRVLTPGDYRLQGNGQTITFTISGDVVEPPIDSDGDGVPDNIDAFPNDPAETTDSDNDGVGDNADAFPNDPTETSDSDNDGFGDNSDPAPNDPNIPNGNDALSLLNCQLDGDRVNNAFQQWHRIEVLCSVNQPFSENDDETFRDNRFDLVFSRSGSSTEYRVPGHFAADGDAANTSANSGSLWRAYFSAPEAGSWTYSASLRQGDNVASSLSANAGSASNTLSGSFDVSEVSAPIDFSDNRDLRLRGLLQHNSGERYLRFAGSGDIFIQGGIDSPENIFGYHEFDNTQKNFNSGSCKGILHRFDTHAADWNAGDPTWQNGKGRALVGLVNYLAEKNLNSVYIMANTKNGDGCDAHPWSDYNTNDFLNYDVSKLDQWEIVLDHMTQNGIMIHLVTQETENDQMINGGDLGTARRIYYRELISRFGHHPALQINLGEENNNSTSELMAFADYIKAIDPYDHPLMLHTFPSGDAKERIYRPLLGFNNFDGPSLQLGDFSGVYNETRKWVNESAAAGHPWYVTLSEVSGGAAPKPNESVTTRQRVDGMYANLMAGGAGTEWYLKRDGAGHAYDLAVEDLREFDSLWDQTGYFVGFIRDHINPIVDLQALESMNDLTSSNDDWVLAEPGNAYLIMLRSGGSTNVSLESGNYSTLWFDPVSGAVSNGLSLVGPGNVSIGSSPSGNTNQDMMVLVYQDDSIVVTESINVSLVDGSGLTENFEVTESQQISAGVAPLGMVFERWVGDIDYLSDRNSETPSIVNLGAVSSPADGLVFVAEYRLADNNSSDNPSSGWKDSVSVFNRSTQQYECYCDSNGYDHDIGDVLYTLPSGQSETIRNICEDIIGKPDPLDVQYSRDKGLYFEYNDIQCGNGPENNAGDEDLDRCPGRVDSGTAGCGLIGPAWDLSDAGSGSGSSSGNGNGNTDIAVHTYAKNEGPDKNPLKGWNSGWSSGFPEASVGFQYLDWNVLEPQNNQFDWDAVENIIDRSGSRGRHLILRLYCDWHGDNYTSRGCPSWIYQEAGVERLQVNGRYITDFNNQNFIDEAIEAINALAERYDNDPRVFNFQVGILGYWGEWHTWPTDYEISRDAEMQILNAYRTSFNRAKIVARYPWKEPLSSFGEMGFHNDYFKPVGHSYQFDDAVAESSYWLDGPIGGEMPPGVNSGELDTLFNTAVGMRIIETARYSTMKPAFDNNFRNDHRDGYMRMHRKMGYNYQIDSASFAENLSQSDELAISLSLDNIGVAPIYYSWDIQFALLDDNQVPVKIISADNDLQELLPNSSLDISVQDSLYDVASGNYSVAVRIIQPGADATKANRWKLDVRNTYIVLSNDLTVVPGRWQSNHALAGGWSILGQLDIQ